MPNTNRQPPPDRVLDPREARVLAFNDAGRSVDYIADYLQLTRCEVRRILAVNGVDLARDTRSGRKNALTVGYRRSDSITPDEACGLMRGWKRGAS